MLFTAEVLLTLLMIYVALTALYNLRTMLRLPFAGAGRCGEGLVSVLIPARNEAANIGSCLDSVLSQQGVQIEILVLDDDSRDKTADIVESYVMRDPRVRLLRGAPLPSGWQGKAWACHQLAHHARGEWLLFLDADSRPHADAIASGVAAAEGACLDLLSLIPDMQLHTFGLRVLMAMVPFVLVGWVPHDLFTVHPNPMFAVAYGPFILVRRSVYEMAGGHAAICDDIVDDVGLARAVKRAGGRVALADGVDVLSVACYRDYVSAWRGMAKSMYPVFNYRPSHLLLAMVSVVLIYASPYLLITNALWTGVFTAAGFWLPFCQILLACAAMGVTGRRYNIPTSYAPLYPLTLLSAIGYCTDSVLTYTFGPGTIWKDRVYRLGHR